MTTNNGFFGWNPKALLFWGLAITSGIMLYRGDVRGTIIFGVLAVAAYFFA